MNYNGLTMAKTNSPLIELVKSRIRYFMTIKDLSFYELSMQSGVTEVCIRNWFTARNYTPSMKAIEKIAAALEIMPYELFCSEEEIMPISPEKRALLQKLDTLTPKQKDAITLLIDSFKE